MMRVTAFAHAAMAMVLMLILVTSVTAELPRYHVEIVEEGPSLGPAEGSADLFLDTQPDGDHYLLRGYGHEGEYRILDPDLSTVTVLEPPEEGFLVKGCTFSDWGLRLMIWGRASGEVNDTLHLYDADRDAYDSIVLANVTVPLVTIDHARLYAAELILLVAGRDANGTSRVVLTETLGNSTRNRLDVPGNRTVIHSDLNGNLVPVIDEAGGMLIFESNNWSLRDTFAPRDHAPTIYEMHDQRFWTRAFEDGTVIIGQDYEGDVFRMFRVNDGPLEGVMYNKRGNGAVFVISARAAEEGGSTLEFWWTEKDEWPKFHEMHLDGAVAFLHHVPGNDTLFLVGFEDGSIVQHSIDIRDLPGPTEKPWYLDGKYMIPLLLAVAVVLLAWRFLGKRERGRG